MESLGKNIMIGIIIFLIIFLVIAIIFSVLEIIGKWKLYKKAGKNGWEAIIPYYNNWVLVEISGCKWWFFLIIIFSSLISLNISFDINETSQLNFNYLELVGSIINFLALYCVNYNICKKCNKSTGYAVGLTILPFIFYPILGFGSSKYDNNVKVSPYGVFKEGE